MSNAVWAYDVSALMIFIIGGGYFIRIGPSRTSRYNIYLSILFAGVIGSICDLARIYMYGTPLRDSFAWKMFDMGYHICFILVAPIYLIYIIGMTDTWHLIRKKRFWALIAVVIIVACVLIDIAGLHYPIVQYISADGTLVHKWGYYVYYIVVLTHMIIALNYIKTLGQHVGLKVRRVMTLPIVLILAALVIQLLAPEHHIIMFVISINCLLLILVDRSAEDILDITTGMHTYKIFAQNMEMKMSTEKEMELILVNIVNFENMLRIAGYDEMLEMMKPLSEEISRVMKSYKAQFTCYYNGDGKFAIELSKRHFRYVNEIANEIIKAINQNLRLEIADFEIRINACIVNCPMDINDVESLFMLIADLDRIPSGDKVLSASDITGTDNFKMKKEMATILERAIANHYFSVFYQPIYDVNKKKFASAEALIRLRDPKYGYISPGVFIPMAEKNGEIHNIGSFVIDEVCKFIASDEFKELGVDYIEINLSVMQCLRADLADEIISKARKYAIDPAKLNLEITETASAYSQEKLYGNIRALNEAGFTFSLDDFGTGYSNLMRIASLPLSIVKLDRTFVLLEEKTGFHTIIKNLIAMLKDMGLTVLVEGIETEEMVEVFSSMGVEEIQGFYFSKPLTKTDYIAFTRKHNA